MKNSINILKFSACLVLPNGVDVLIGSASFSDYYKSAAIYNIDSNRWTLLNQVSISRFYIQEIFMLSDLEIAKILTT